MSWLHNKHPIVINSDLAKNIGLNEAIILQQLNYWLESTPSGVEHEGVRWIYNTHEKWQEQFPFWSTDTVKRGFASLKDQNLVLVAKLSKNKSDRTNFYTVNHEKLDQLEAESRRNTHQCKMPSCKSAKSTDAPGQSAPLQEGKSPSSSGASCTDLHTEITTETTPESFPDGLPAAPSSPGAMVVAVQVQPRFDIPADMPGPKDQDCKTFKAWANYAFAYRKRYQAWPVWNAKVAGQVGQLVNRLGAEIAHHVAAYYVSINDARLINDCHSLNNLLAKAEAYHTQWATGRQMNGRTARQMEDTQANINAAQEAARNIMGQGERNAFL